LKKLGHNAFYRHEEVKGKGRYYRVYVERFKSREEAEKEAKVLKQLELISDYLIRVIGETTPIGSRERGGNKKNFYLHVWSFKERSNAEREVHRLKGLGSKSFMMAEEISGEKWFRVYIGAFHDEKKARRTGSELMAKGVILYFKPIRIDPKTIASKVTIPSGESEENQMKPKEMEKSADLSNTYEEIRKTKSNSPRGRDWKVTVENY